MTADTPPDSELISVLSDIPSSQNHRQPDVRGLPESQSLRVDVGSAALVRLLLVQEGWGCPGSGGGPRVCPRPECAAHALSDQGDTNKPMFEM